MTHWSNSPQPQPTRKRRIWPWVFGGIAVLFVVGSVANAGRQPTTVAPSFTAPTASAAPSEPPPGGIADGTHVVGTDVQAGAYRTAGPADSVIPNCYWARLKSTDGDLGAIIANANTKGRTTVTIKATDKAFETTGCQPWQKVS